jgi:carboxymethylenebutenolidase
MVTEREVFAQTPDGDADGFLYTADNGSARPGALFLTDIGGIRQANRQMARRLAEQGYSVFMPNIFFRSGRPPIFETPFRAGEEKTVARMKEISEPLTPDKMEQDAAAYIDFMASEASIRTGPIAVVGYCFTGTMALRAAAACPERVAAMGSFHGGRLYTQDARSPHLLLPRVKARLYFGHAVQDKSMPQDAIEKLEAALARWGGQYESEIYQGAYHSWTVPDSPVYNPAQAERAFTKLTSLLTETLQ